MTLLVHRPLSGGLARRFATFVSVLTLAIGQAGCNEAAVPFSSIWAKIHNAVGKPLSAIEVIERHNAASPAAGVSSLALSVRPASLSAEEAHVLQTKLRRYRINSELLGVLSFMHHYKRGEQDLAGRALSVVNKELAKQIVSMARETRKLEQERSLLLARINAEEAQEFEEELEFISRMTDCQRDIYTGAFGGMGETMREKMQFCLLWDSGLLDLIPSPVKAAKAASGIARVTGKSGLMRMTRQELLKLPKFASIAGKYEARRAAAHHTLKQTQYTEKRLVDALLDFQWNIIVEFSNAGRS